MSASRNIRIATDVVSLLICSLLAGVLVAAAAFPALGMTGLGAKEAADSFQNLPSDLNVPPLPVKSQLVAADGSPITSFFTENRVPVTMKDIPVVMQHAMVAAEDSRFYKHRGVDMQGVVRALVANQQAGEVTQGASTLTQQYVKNVLKYNAKTTKEKRQAEAPTAARKLREMRLALAVEQKYTKSQILEGYLNIAFFGNDGYGIAGASQVYFSKMPKDLTLAEAAMLAGAVKSPTQYNPAAGGKHAAAALDRRNFVLRRMAELGYVSKADADKAKKTPIGLHTSKKQGNCNTGVVAYGFYCQYFLDWWKKQSAFGKNVKERMAALDTGGYRITTALDPRIQDIAQAKIDANLSRVNDFAAGTVLVQPGTGHVLGMAVNRTYGHGKNVGVNRPYTENPLLSGKGYQAGSTFKMFTMVAALQKGIPLDTTYNAQYQFETNEPATSGPVCNGHYCPHNDNKNMSAVHSMFSAFGESVNTYFVHLEQQIGVKAAVEASQKLGVVYRAELKNGMNEGESFKENGGLSFTIGTAQVSPLDMANAYATLAARGKHCDPMPVIRVVDRSGKEVKGVGAPHCNQAIPPTIADAANAAARCPTGDGPHDVCTRHNGWTAGYVGSHMEREIAGKSGTTDNDAASWLVGYTPNLASAVFIANPDSPTEDVGSDLHERPKVIFTQIMNDALNGMPNQDFTDPPGSLVHGETSGVPDVAGMDLAQAKSQIRSAGFSWHVESAQVPSQYPAGKVAKTDPAGGSSATVNSDVSIYVSNGQGATGPGGTGIPGIPGLPGKPGKPHR